VSSANPGQPAAGALMASSVLVVDDEPDLLTLYELTLLREGLEVETASSVTQAREILQTRVFRAVISDMRLTCCSGWRRRAVPRR
jgi:two-component system response regulator PilR (NtrC family)